MKTGDRGPRTGDRKTPESPADDSRFALASRALEVMNAPAHGAYRVGLRRSHRAAVPVPRSATSRSAAPAKTPLVAARARAWHWARGR
jgi:hypothetical protein